MLDFILKYQRYLSMLLYGILGAVMGSGGWGLTTWQFWGVIVCVNLADWLSLIKGLDDGWDRGYKCGKDFSK